MPMLKTVLFATVFTLSACGKKDEKKGDPPAGDPKGADDRDKLPGGAPMAKATDPGKYNCDTILKKEIRDKYFAGWKIENIDFPVKHAGKCKLIAPDGNDTELGAACQSFMKNAKDQTIPALQKQFPDFKAVEGVEDIVIAREISPDLPDVMFTGYSKGSFCQIDGTLPKTIDLKAFLNDWFATLPTS